jgi:hypothetical protein
MDKLDDLVATHLEDRLLQPERLNRCSPRSSTGRQERSERQREHIASTTLSKPPLTTCAHSPGVLRSPMVRSYLGWKFRLLQARDEWRRNAVPAQDLKCRPGGTRTDTHPVIRNAVDTRIGCPAQLSEK